MFEVLESRYHQAGELNFFPLLCSNASIEKIGRFHEFASFTLFPVKQNMFEISHNISCLGVRCHVLWSNAGAGLGVAFDPLSR